MLVIKKIKSVNWYLLGLFFLIGVTMSAQERTISGKVTSNEDPLGLPGVNIIIKGTTTGVSSDMDGNYSIKVKNNNVVLVFNYIGFTTKEIVVGDKKVINVVLSGDVSKLDEIVLIGYGSSLKKDLTSSVSVVDLGDAQKISAPRIEQTLGGKIAGVNITSPNSEPGAALSIRIRGGNSINGDNSPLLVVDGVLGGDFESLNVNDIESMQVLKDASATAIYGSLGANGVIIVSTKKGKIGKIKVDVFSSTGVQQVRKTLDLFDAEQHIQFLTQDPDFDYPADINNVANPILSGKGTDWQDEIFRKAMYNNLHLNISHGSDKIRTFFSLDYLDQEGVVIESGYKKIAGRLSTDFKISDKFSVTSKVSAYKTASNQIKTNEDYGSFGSPITMTALQFSPLIPVYAEDGSFNPDLNTAYIRDNPVSTAKNLNDFYEGSFLQNVLAANWKITDDLTYDFSASFSSNEKVNKRYISKALLRASNVGEATIANSKSESWQLRNTLTYNKLFNDVHNISVLAGYEMSENKFFSSSMTGRGFATEISKYNNIGLADVITEAKSRSISSGLVSYLARVTYGYKSKYLFSVSERADGSTKFATNNKWAYFPSGSVAWVASEENFLADSKSVNHLKLRASYGKSGSQAISPYQSLAQYSTGLIYSQGGSDLFNGVFINQVANTNLKWETTSQFDFGFDLELYDSKIGVTYDYFSKTTEDLLFNKGLLAYTGIESQIQNIGELENKGHEFGFDAKVLDGKLKWDVSANVTFVKNKVIDLGGDDNIYISPVSGSRGSGFATAGVLKVGEAIGNFFGYQADGIFKTQADIDAINQPGAQLGNVRYKDTNEDGVINSDDRQIIGNALPDYTFGINNNFSYGNFDLNVAIQGVQGNEVIWFDQGNINTVDRLNGWSTSNPDTTIPRQGRLGSDTNSNYVEDGSFIKFKNISLGYNFTKDVLKKLGMSNMRVYVSAVDAFVISKYPGYDPEVNSKSGGDDNFSQNVALGFDEGSYPGVSQFIVGLNISF